MENQKSIKFTIDGAPVGYLRVTQGQVRLLKVPDWKLDADKLEVKRRIQKYITYKEVCQWAAHKEIFERSPRGKVFLNCVVYFSEGLEKFNCHPDPENVRKAVQDALFLQDNKVAGAVDYFYDAKNPRVEVEIVEP